MERGWDKFEVNFFLYKSCRDWPSQWANKINDHMIMLLKVKLIRFKPSSSATHSNLFKCAH